MAQSIGPMLRKQWRLLSGVPAGQWLFSRALGLMVPYTGSIGGVVRKLEPGCCVVTLTDRRKVRNHLHSVHAIAQCNLGEMVTGLALMNSLPDQTRGILKGLSVEYLKKARGTLTAECRCEIPPDNQRREYQLTGEIRDAENEPVATITADWLIGPEKE
ncbi:MAG: hotdog fold domain-containing protein [Gammaproteobacteria bacterium]